MENYQTLLYKFAFLLALISCYQILSLEGRPIRDSIDKKQTSIQVPIIDQHNDHSSEEIKRKMVPHKLASDQSSSFSNSKASYKDAFRPTTPGSSPGAGHSFQQQRQQNEPKTQLGGDHDVQNMRHSVTGFKDDFRPTAPGHSPSIGHAREAETAEPKA